MIVKSLNNRDILDKLCFKPLTINIIYKKNFMFYSICPKTSKWAHKHRKDFIQLWACFQILRRSEWMQVCGPSALASLYKHRSYIHILYCLWCGLLATGSLYLGLNWTVSSFSFWMFRRELSDSWTCFCLCKFLLFTQYHLISQWHMCITGPKPGR